jgi:hypothetical protein
MASARAGTPHLFSAVIVVGIAATIVFAGRLIAIHFEQKTVQAVAPRVFDLKNQGLAFQRAAAYLHGKNIAISLSPVWFVAPDGLHGVDPVYSSIRQRGADGSYRL